MELKELNKLIEKGELMTRDFGAVRKLVEVCDIKHRKMYEVYVKGISWCIGTVYANNGLLEDGEQNGEDLIYPNH